MATNLNWRTTHAATLNEMWQKHIQGRMGTCAMCNKCGGSSTSFCSCVKTRYMNNLTLANVEEYQKKKTEQNKPKTAK